jgi:hypothetical protein
VLLGDSYTAGQDVTNADRFSDLLERRYPNLDVMNFGLYGTGTDQQLIIYETLGKRFEADAYIFAPYWSNIARNMLDLFAFGTVGGEELWMPKPCFTLNADELVLHNTPVPRKLLPENEAAKHLELSTRGRLYETLFPGTPQQTAILVKLYYALTKPYSGYESAESASWKLMRAILERFIKEIEEKRVFIMPLPDAYHYFFGIPPTYLARYHELRNGKENCVVVDALPFFKRLSHEERRDCVSETNHYSPLGHSIIAGAISDSIEKYCPDLLK